MERVRNGYHVLKKQVVLSINWSRVYNCINRHGIVSGNTQRIVVLCCVWPGLLCGRKVGVIVSGWIKAITAFQCVA